jgi:hypothetical protein
MNAGVWDDWLKLRKAKKAPVTETVVTSARGEAKKAGMSFEDFLRVWCTRGSQGLLAEWIKPHERTKPPPPPPAVRNDEAKRLLFGEQGEVIDA